MKGAKRTTTYLFRKNVRDVMDGHLDRSTLFAFDLDGTLAPIASSPDAIGIPAGICREMTILSGLAVIAIITGRSRRDALRHLAFEPHYLIGNHGAEGLPGWNDRTLEFTRTVGRWQDQLEALLPAREQNGIMIENKGATLSIHYRQSAGGKVTRHLIVQAVRRLEPKPRLISGIFVENLIPRDAPDKGAALRILMQETRLLKSFFAGDDETDEEVFRSGDGNIFTVRVGRKAGSHARYYVKDQREVIRLLRLINRILGRKQISPPPGYLRFRDGGKG